MPHRFPRTRHPDAARLVAERSRQAAGAVAVGFAVNLGLAAGKGIAGILGHSYALVADAVESLLDIFGSVVVWFGLRVSKKEPDLDHPWGHGKAEPFASIAVGLLMLLAAGGIAIESVREIITPHHAPAPWTLVVLVAVIAVKEILFRTVLRAARETESGAVEADAWHHRSDAITSAAAFLGILVALLGGKGFEMADDIAAVFAAGLIAFNASRLMLPAVQELMDASPPAEIDEGIRRTALAVEGVYGLHRSMVRRVGFDLWVDLQVIVSGELTVREGHDIAHRVKDAVVTSHPRVVDVNIHVEPHEILSAPGAEVSPRYASPGS